MKPILPRPFLWKDLQEWDEFLKGDAINDVFNGIIKKLAQKKQIPYMKPLIVFNELYYLLSRLYYEEDSPRNYLDYEMEIKDDLRWEHCEDVVMIMIYYYVQLRPPRHFNNYSILDEIHQNMSESVIWNEFESGMPDKQLPQPSISPIKPSPVSPKFLDNNSIDWSEITYGFNLDYIKEVIKLWEKHDDKRMIAAMIEERMDSILKSHPDHKQKFQKVRDFFRNEKMIEDSASSDPYVETQKLQAEIERLQKKSQELKQQHEENKNPKEEENKEGINRSLYNDPSIYAPLVPFLIYDENNETIISRTAKGINEGKLNPYEVDWMEVTLYECMFVKPLLGSINSEFIIDVAQAIDDEENMHTREDGQYTQVSSDYYGTGQGDAAFHSHTIDNWDETTAFVSAVSIAESILDKRKKAEEYRKKINKKTIGQSSYLKNQHEESLEVGKGGTNNNNVTGLNETRQSKLNEIIEILKKGNWKNPATVENITKLLNIVFGRDRSLLDKEDVAQCENLWGLVEGGRNDRMVIVPANLAGFFAEENLLKGSPKDISNDLFASDNQINNINKGNSNRCSKAFTEVIPFLQKYIRKLIR